MCSIQRRGSPDGKLLAYTEERPDQGSDILILPIDGDRKPRTFLATASNERNPTISPDGRWVAYESDETGHFEVFITSFPEAGRRWQVSDGGGSHPVWRRDAREIVYRAGDRLMSVAITAAPAPQPGRPRELVKLHSPG